jgi:nucleoside-diphosphate-sugar epimerase
MKALFIGGTGVISSACSALAIEQGIDLYVLNRGRTARPVPDGAHLLIADIRDRGSVMAALANREFDVVVDWLGFLPEHVEADVELFAGRTRQYIFISSASIYQKPLSSLPITESTPLHNPYWDYSQAKIACEERLLRAYREEGFPVTIVRPSHTYDCTKVPLYGYYTTIDRLRRGKPAIVPGDGTSLWVLTHSRDFARGFAGLLGNATTLGQAYHITSDEVLSWNQIYGIVARAAGAEPRFVHVPSAVISAFDPKNGPGIAADKSHSVIFDNAKIRRAVPGFVATIPFSRGAEELLAWYDADPARQILDDRLDHLMDQMVDAMGRLLEEGRSASRERLPR